MSWREEPLTPVSIIPNTSGTNPVAIQPKPIETPKGLSWRERRYYVPPSIETGNDFLTALIGAITQGGQTWNTLGSDTRKNVTKREAVSRKSQGAGKIAQGTSARGIQI